MRVTIATPHCLRRENKPLLVARDIALYVGEGEREIAIVDREFEQHLIRVDPETHREVLYCKILRSTVTGLWQPLQRRVSSSRCT